MTFFNSNTMPKFSASDRDLLKAKNLRDKDLLKAKKASYKKRKKAEKAADKAAKDAFEKSEAGQKQRVAKKARNRFLAKSYGKTLWTVPASVAATFLSGGALWWTIPIAAGGNALRAAGEALAYSDNEHLYGHDNAKCTFSRAKMVRRNTEKEYDELKRLAAEKKSHQQKGADENASESLLDFSPQEDY